MKTVFKIIILLFFSNTVLCQSNSDSIIRTNKVKEVRIVDSENKVASLTKYDSLGRMTFNALDNFGGATFLKTTLAKIYNDQGNNIQTISTHSSYPNERTVWFYEYDKNGNRTSIKTQDGNLVFQFVYDESNFLIKELSYDDDNTIRQTKTFQREIVGKKIISKNSGSFIKNRTTTTYLDENGQEIKVESYDGDKINFSASSVYKKNNLIRKMYNSGDGENYFYDSEGRLTKRQLFKTENGQEIPGSFEIFSYSSKGLIEKYVENIYAGNILREYEYEYEFYN